MNLIFSDFGMFNHNPTVLGTQPVLNAQVITPHIVVMKNAAARAHGMTFGTVWSIYDLFTGRREFADKVLKVSDLTLPGGYTRETPHRYVNVAGEKITIGIRDGEAVSDVQYFNKDNQLTQKEIYDDGGFLMSRETPFAPDTIKAEMLDTAGQPIFELLKVGRWGAISQVTYVPDNLIFENESKFLRWAFEQLVARKSATDKFFVASNQLRDAIRESWYKPQGVILLMLEPFVKSLDILFDHYETVVFNDEFNLNNAINTYGERSESQFVWNNFIPTDLIHRNFTADNRQIYINLGAGSQLLNYEKIADVIKEIFDYQPELRIILQVNGRRSRDAMVAHINWRGKEQLEKVEFYANPNPSFIKRKIAESMLYIDLMENDMVSHNIALALSAQIPILSLKENEPAKTYVSDETGKVVAFNQLAMVAKEAVANLGFYSRLADNLEAKQQFLSTQKTAERWRTILK
ncbi:hypothetical protein Hs30E_15540 [Lactococcus hodotermopsidis]|uniref:Uncharacterized protein n=1 Tax=Pseudolactococcus hodotermopsidis TaxID=2709157 RepID=A0A6A0BE78_9LACT|nr:hypothetical protein [Lactococcus hodotermopsidis]GFH43003.1 hypothetical protein Hs30E_15540 [Lactococcus hodotermopsidis]